MRGLVCGGVVWYYVCDVWCGITWVVVCGVCDVTYVVWYVCCGLIFVLYVV